MSSEAPHPAGLDIATQYLLYQLTAFRYWHGRSALHMAASLADDGPNFD
jgi:hypothetical protein